MPTTRSKVVPPEFDVVRRALGGATGGARVSYRGQERVARGRRLVGFWCRRRGAPAAASYVALVGQGRRLLAYSMLDLDDAMRVRDSAALQVGTRDASWATDVTRAMVGACVEGVRSVHPLSCLFREESGLWETLAGVLVRGDEGMRQYRCEVDGDGRQARLTRLHDLW